MCLRQCAYASVPIRQCAYASVPICQCAYASVPICQCAYASVPMPVYPHQCAYMPVCLRQCAYASVPTPVCLRQCAYASVPVRQCAYASVPTPVCLHQCACAPVRLRQCACASVPEPVCKLPYLIDQGHARYQANISSRHRQQSHAACTHLCTQLDAAAAMLPATSLNRSSCFRPPVSSTKGVEARGADCAQLLAGIAGACCKHPPACGQLGDCAENPYIASASRQDKKPDPAAPANNASQVASLVTALCILGWRPPSSFWPCLYASAASKPAPSSGRIPAAVLLALAKYGAMAAEVEEADAAAAALRAEASSSVASGGDGSSGGNDSARGVLAQGQAGSAPAASAPPSQTPPHGGAADVAAVHAPAGAAPADRFLLPPGMLVQRLLDHVTGKRAALCGGVGWRDRRVTGCGITGCSTTSSAKKVGVWATWVCWVCS